MPQVILRYTASYKQLRTLPHQLIAIGRQFLPHIAQLASTDEVPLTVDDIEWYPQRIELGSIAPKYSLEIRTIGYDDRKERFGRDDVKALKVILLAILGTFCDSEEDKLTELPIWVHFIDPDGVHV